MRPVERPAPDWNGSPMSIRSAYVCWRPGPARWPTLNRVTSTVRRQSSNWSPRTRVVINPGRRCSCSRAATWLEARRGGTRSGAEHAASRGRFLDEAWHQTWGAWTAYDAVRLGHPDLVVDDLERASSASADGAVQLFARQARAYVDGDGATLADIASRFESVGARAHAAEAHAHAASVFASPDVVARHRQRSIVLASRCPGLASPVVEQIDAPLSAREQEIGILAAAGRSSKEIADQLFVSPRTVDNHLGAAYSKLGLVGRAELAEWFTVTHSVVDDYSILI